MMAGADRRTEFEEERYSIPTAGFPARPSIVMAHAVNPHSAWLVTPFG